MALHDFIEWSGLTVNAVFTFSGNFWSTPAGILISSSIMFCSSIHVFSRKIDDTLFERIWHSCVAVIMFCAVIVGIDPGHSPHYFVQVLLFFWAFRHIHDVVHKLRSNK